MDFEFDALKIARQAELHVERKAIKATLEQLDAMSFNITNLDPHSNTWVLIANDQQFRLSIVQAEKKAREMVREWLQEHLASIEANLQSLERKAEEILGRAGPAKAKAAKKREAA